MAFEMNFQACALLASAVNPVTVCNSAFSDILMYSLTLLAQMLCLNGLNISRNLWFA